MLQSGYGIEDVLAKKGKNVYTVLAAQMKNLLYGCPGSPVQVRERFQLFRLPRFFMHPHSYVEYYSLYFEKKQYPRAKKRGFWFFRPRREYAANAAQSAGARHPDFPVCCAPALWVFRNPYATGTLQYGLFFIPLLFPLAYASLRRRYFGWPPSIPNGAAVFPFCSVP